MSLAIRHLSKQYPDGTRALHDVSLDIPTGLFGLLGPNGAGKSTLMRILATLQTPDEGTVSFAGEDVLTQPQALKKILGYLPQEFGLYPHMTAQDFLLHFVKLSGYTDKRQSLEMADKLLETTNLTDVRNSKLKTFSGGMKQRFGIALALIGNPELIILDEPVSGLDPEERTSFLNLLNRVGMRSTVLLSTHIVDDVAGNCPQMAIINHGKIVYQGETQKAIEQLKGKLWAKHIENGAEKDAESAYRVISKKLVDGKTSLRVYGPGAPNDGFNAVEPTLEDAYFFWLSETRINEEKQ